MGNSLPTIEAPITKRTSSIIVFSKSQYKPEPKANCMHPLLKCIASCPVRLHPVMIYNAIMKGDFEQSRKTLG